MSDKLLIIGISGVTCGGKTTIASELNKILPRSRMISQDDYFRTEDDPLHVWIPELNHINFDIMSSLNMEKMYYDIVKTIEGKDLNFFQNHQLTSKAFPSLKDLEESVQLKVEGSGMEILIIEGFCIFNYKPLLPLFHLKYYFTLPKDECRKRREKRTYEPPDCPGYFEKCVWPEHLKQIEEVHKSVEDVKYFSGSDDSMRSLHLILGDILRCT